VSERYKERVAGLNESTIEIPFPDLALGRRQPEPQLAALQRTLFAFELGDVAEHQQQALRTILLHPLGAVPHVDEGPVRARAAAGRMAHHFTALQAFE